MRQGIKTDVSNAVQCEYSASMEKFPLFSSAHEGYAVILEEIEEATDELNYIKTFFEFAWTNIKDNDVMGYKENVAMLREHARLLACEAIQVAAMCEKFEKSAEGWQK